LDESPVEPYHTKVKDLFRLPPQRKEFYRNLSKIDPPALRVAVDAFREDPGGGAGGVTTRRTSDGFRTVSRE
jgi:hypothetical protein